MFGLSLLYTADWTYSNTDMIKSLVIIALVSVCKTSSKEGEEDKYLEELEHLRGGLVTPVDTSQLTSNCRGG